MRRQPSSQDLEIRDLIVLVADHDCRFTVQALLRRHAALGIRGVSFVVESHPEKDPGCFRRCDDFLRARQRHFAHSLVMFDREGCGQDRLLPEDLERDVVSRLDQSGWSGRCGAVALEPELESWVWSASPNVDRALGWHDRSPDLRTWLRNQGYLAQANTKPGRPKEALEAALRHVRTPWSSAIHARLAETFGLRQCTDQAFLRFRQTLRAWFPASSSAPGPPLDS